MPLSRFAFVASLVLFGFGCESLGPPPAEMRPVATNDEFSVSTDTTTLEEGAPGILENDVDPDKADADSDPEVSALEVQDPGNVSAGNGTLELNADGSFTYTPQDGFSGEDSFTYNVIDTENGKTSPVEATVTITVK